MLRVLLLADTHIGFDEPRRPRVRRRRRGPDFLACFRRALRPALEGRVDLVVHGGDLLYRARVPADLVARAMEPLIRVADRGVPVCLVPGNHERSRIPYPLLAQHPRIHIFHRPHTFALDLAGVRVALAGFPFARRLDGRSFRELLACTGWERVRADLRLLCLHQAVEGARVGIQDYTFRAGREVLARRDLPTGFAAILCGHIHRAQVLHGDGGGNGSPPVLYPGSVERTSFQEREETKGYLLLEFEPGAGGGRLSRWTFHPLPARPMRVLRLAGRPRHEGEALARLRLRLKEFEPDAVVRVEFEGPHPDSRSVRALAPPTMNVTLARREA